MKALLLTLVVLLPAPIAQGQLVMSGHWRKIFAAGCAAPTMTYRWAAYNSSNTCGATGGSSCSTSGQAVYSVADFVAGNTLKQAATSAQPTFETSAVNSRPALSFNGSSNYMTMATPVPVTNTTYTFYAVFNPANVASGFIFGNYLGYGVQVVVRLYQTHLQFIVDAGASPDSLSGSTVLSTGTWYTMVATYNLTSRAAALYLCSAGTCSSQGTATLAAQTLTKSLGALGTGNDSVTNPFDGYLAEAGYFNGIDSNPSADIGAWSYCWYGI
ncbi:MAG: LamG-like jellyroll fold domain-containing protein [Terracidiphilus sp.]